MGGKAASPPRALWCQAEKQGPHVDSGLSPSPKRRYLLTSSGGDAARSTGPTSGPVRRHSGGSASSSFSWAPGCSNSPANYSMATRHTAARPLLAPHRCRMPRAGLVAWNGLFPATGSVRQSPATSPPATSPPPGADADALVDGQSRDQAGTAWTGRWGDGMGQLRRSRWWLLWLGLRALDVGLAATAVVAAFGWLLWRGPAWVYRGAWPRLTAAEQVTATGQFRVALIQFAGAAGAVMALAYTGRTYRLAHRGQLTERFSKALERLGSDEPYVRLGGVHALAHVLRDSADHHRDVVEVLVAFVRQRAPRVASPTGVRSHGADTRSGVLLVTSDQALPAEPAPDVQAALTALGHHPRRLEARVMLNLGDLHLARAVLNRADLTDASLGGANLTRAWLTGANLARAVLNRADLTDTWLGGANLTRARLEGANLTAVQLHEADLTDAWLEGANLTGAQLLEANLTRAWLGGADLTGAHDLTQAQVEAALGDAATRLPTELERPAWWTADQEAVADASPASGPAPGGPPAPPTEHP